MLNSLDRQVIGEIHAHGLSLNEVWRKYKDATKRPLIGLADAISQFLQDKQQQGCKTLYLASLRQDLGQFSRWHGPDVPVHTIPTFVPQLFLKSYTPATAATKKQRLNAFFGWLIRRGYLEVNPCANLDAIRKDYEEPVILSNLQVRQLLSGAKESAPDMLPFLFLALGLGLRISEAKKISSEDVKNGVVKVSAKVAKGGSRRVVEIPSFLSPTPRKVGYIAPRNVKRKWNMVREASGIKPWPRNACRHTAATHLLNMFESEEKVGLILGHRPKVLHSHYKGAAAKSESEEFYGILQSYFSTCLFVLTSPQHPPLNYPPLAH